MALFQIELTTANGQFITVQRESTMSEYVKMSIASEFKNCKIHNVKKISTDASTVTPENIFGTSQAQLDQAVQSMPGVKEKIEKSNTEGCIGCGSVILGGGLMCGVWPTFWGFLVGGVLGFVAIFFIRELINKAKGN